MERVVTLREEDFIMSFTGLLNSTFDLISLGMSADAYGGWSSSPATVSAMSSVPCRVSELSATEREMLSREGTSASHKVFCDYTSVITVKHELLISGLRYQILRCDDIDRMGHHLELTTNITG
jgi:SPP1 family predicted phage head-tail adaptor